MKKSKKLLVLGFGSFLVLVLLVGLVFFGFGQSLLSGQGSPFVFSKMTCSDSTYSCRVGGYLALYDRTGAYRTSGQNVVEGSVEVIPKCGVYYLTVGNSLGGSTVCSGSSYVDVYMNNVEVAETTLYDYYNAAGHLYDSRKTWLANGTYLYKTGQVTNFDVTRFINQNSSQNFKISVQAVANTNSYSCDAEFGGLTISSNECIGDRLFVKTCPLWKGYSVMGREFVGGQNVSLSDFPSDAYFCSSQAAIVKDSNNAVIGNDASPYTVLNQGGVFTVPSGQSYIMIFVSGQNSDAKINELNVFIGQLQGTLDEKIALVKKLNLDVQTQIDIANSLQLSLDEKIKYVSELQSSIANQDLMISALTNKLDEQMRMVSSLQSESANQALMIQQLSELNTKQLGQISDLNAQIIMQGDMINLLTSNLAKKSEYANLLTVENQRQADLLIAMRESFANQGQILDGMNLTIEQDAKIISNLTDNLVYQGQILDGMKTTLAEKEATIKLLQVSLDNQIALANQLQISNAEKDQIIKDLKNEISTQQGIISGITDLLFAEKNTTMKLNESLIIEQQHLLALGQLNAKDKVILNQQLALLEAEKSKQAWIYGFIILILFLVIIFCLIFIFKKKKKSRRR